MRKQSAGQKGKRAMNIGNRYSSWMHNAPGTGYGNRSGQTGKTGADKAFFSGKKESDESVIKDEAAEKTEGKTKEEENADAKNPEEMTLREQILAHMEEMAKKVREGKVEPSFRIGGQEFTIKEWEKLLADFDDAEEGLQELIKEQIVEVEKQAAKEAARRKAEGQPDSDAAGTVVTNVSVPTDAQPNVEAGGSVANPHTEPAGSATAVPAASAAVDDNVTEVEVTDPEELAELLTGQIAKSTFPTDDPKNKHWFITCFGQDGITCREAYMENGKWVNRSCWNLPYTEPGQREKVLAFIQRFPQDANLRFACHENFWEDFLAGEIDEDDFVNFFETSTDKDGVPDYTYEKDGSTYIDREKVKYAKYMNDFGVKFYTAEEMDLLWRGIIHENSKKVGHEEDDLETKIITKPDGSTVLQIETNFGVMEVEITEAQKFGLQYEAHAGQEISQGTPFVNKK